LGGPDGQLVLATAVALLSAPGGAVIALGHLISATEVGVQSGTVTVSAPSGEHLGVVGPGEVLTVRDNGERHKQPLPTSLEDFGWDLANPPREGWRVGRIDTTAAGLVLRPERWFDPYHKAEMYQIRSNPQWARGYCRLTPESKVRLRYRVARPGPGQVVFCVRSPKMADADTGVVEWNGIFGPAGGWQELNTTVADMIENRHAPKSDPPWLGFLVIVNAYESDIGLEVAELRVTRPGRPAAGK